MIPLETQIFRLIFPPVGAIPLEKIEAVPHIRQHINSIIDLASTEHGISPPDESAALTARVIELRDTPGPDGKIRTWRTIAEICGTTLDAVRHRYVKGKATIRKSRTVEEVTPEEDRFVGLLTEPVDPIQAINEAFATVRELVGDVVPGTEGTDIPKALDSDAFNVAHLSTSGEFATIRGVRLADKPLDAAGPGFLWERPEVRPDEAPTKPTKAIITRRVDPWPDPVEPEKKPDEVATTGLTPCQRGQLIGPKIPHELDDEIIMLREAGNPLKEIVNHLQVLGIKCTEADVSARVISEQKKRAAKKVEESAVQEAADPITQDDTAQPEEEPQEAEATDNRPEPRSISRKELDLRIWDMWRAGKTFEEISEILYSEGLYYSAKSVRVRLLSQGAKL